MIPRFYCPVSLAEGATVSLPGETFHHAVRVRRLRLGDLLVLFAGDGLEAEATLSAIRRDSAEASVGTVTAVDRESPLDVTLLQGISTGDRMDYTLQKAVELGVGAVVPLALDRSQTPKSGRADKRVAHWQQIVLSACEQSGRNRIPAIHPIASLADALRSRRAPTALLLTAATTTRLCDLTKPQNPFTLLAGPEGGLTGAEESAAVDAGFIPVSLGPRILRTETAAVAALAAMQSLWGDG